MASFRSCFGAGTLLGALPGGILGGGVALCVAHLAQASPARVDGSEEPAQRRLIVVDADDDNDNGVADSAERPIGSAPLKQLLWLPSGALDPQQVAPKSGLFRLVSAQGIPFSQGASLPADRVALQGLMPGLGSLRTAKGPLKVAVIELRALDTDGRPVDLARSHASLSRDLPAELEPERPDRDALRWLALGPPQDVPQTLRLLSLGADGQPRDSLGPVPLARTQCPPGTDPELICRISPAIRASTDPIDRGHPAAAARSILAEVGGRLRAELEPGVGVSIRVGGPRHAAGYDVGRYRAVVRTHVVSMVPGSPAVGADDEQALAIVRQELATANALWGQCGIHFGAPESMEAHIIPVPPPHLFAVGCGEGQPASGGTIRLTVGGRLVELSSRPGELPVTVATRLAQRIEALGFRARVSVNAGAHRAAQRTADVLVRDTNDRFVLLGTPEQAPASSDPSLPVCLGEVDLSDGLQHFTDFDAGAGTVEERALIKALEDDDPATIELIVIPSFSGSGRIGESFIFGPGASLQNAVILDRAGIRAGARSFTLAHELGHILLDMPGHPDDFGIDMPTSLMDADAADATIFGPRRLSIDDCERAMRQTGPASPVPLLTPWPLFSDGPATP